MKGNIITFLLLASFVLFSEERRPGAFQQDLPLDCKKWNRWGTTSQCGQDMWVLSTFADGTPPGYFVDLAANHPFHLSNTYALEQNNWNGICIEAQPQLVDLLREHRKCQVFPSVVSYKPDLEVEFVFNGALSGILGRGYDNDLYLRRGYRGPTETFNTTTLEMILEQAGAPSVISYLSLDVEGAEWDVLKRFPFGKYTFLTLSVERPPGCLVSLLFAYGYRVVKEGCKFGDIWMIHETHPQFDQIPTVPPTSLHVSTRSWGDCFIVQDN